jgi:hypothetical protein
MSVSRSSSHMFCLIVSNILCVLLTLLEAPVNELRCALTAGKLGPLNPTPWGVMTGNAVVSEWYIFRGDELL